MKNILAIHTGGTISMSQDEGGAVVPNAQNPISNEISGLTNINVINEELFNLPSPHMTPQIMLQVKNRIQKAIEDGIDGVVVTHGTDSLEETAYFLDLTLPSDIPVVVTGAMRSSNEIGSDGFFNFKSAIQVAASDKSKHKGVLVVFNAAIYAARYVTKTHTTSVDTFKAPVYGALGTVEHGRVNFVQELIGSATTDIDHVIEPVYLLKTYTGMTETFFKAIDNYDTKGVVIEAMGAGNLPPKTVPAIEKMLQHKIPVILVSRCFMGYAQPVYAYEGGGVRLQQMGITFSENLNGPKARIKLIVGLSAGKTGNQLKEYMSNAIS
ncbi:asparaginase [Fructilactobacillus lindneri]|uniref:L-asparaginase n=2 Tax=Fructilactobacillus lindneri TaxID=53444 RepID=A0A0R2JVH8_9LACO|nr:asparaginase [Fructilactobacillus lindneri]ANZ57832.1 L-asparaginase [Fructilactobacillus lindneri]ANZ59101.1 L-asparaginase [Fructilactobacillus lindneri]KRN78714.1 L-asparaginase [Fructilactobacillus lindneri DSM 20690 = JCM 11027]POG98154.1 L-asparaginase [Fructilactobacillus lindneri]POH01730.1 L-asparaginase [Fructilactobacillus lindneri]